MVLYLIRHAFRQLVREPAFTVAALLTLALGVGANVAVFAVVDAVLLRPLPYLDADQLVILNHRDKRTGITKEFIAIGDYVDLVSRQGAFESLAAYGRGQTSIIDRDDPYRVDCWARHQGCWKCFVFVPCSVARSSPKTLARVHRR